jgi:DNA-binding MarR family transcriptional regulator/N-acetylglutamate synthase-like GNAT family acetyltransferase
MVAQVRRFNRTVTQRVGALHDRFLARARPLGAARVLWEIGDDGCEVRALRSRLDLDAGYLSRLLRALETDGLITVDHSDVDKRVRTVHLTVSGAAERAVLEQRSDELAVSLLAPLSAAQRDRLVVAMGDVERLLTAATVEIAPIDPAHPSARHCLREYYAELDRRFEAGFDPALSRLADTDELRPPTGLFLLASMRSDPVGCGVVRFHDTQPSEIKRMWVAESARGLGIGRRLLDELEAHAAARGSSVVRLDSNRALTEAIAMYHSAGYVEVEAFNDERYAQHWFEKHLAVMPAHQNRR